MPTKKSPLLTLFSVIVIDLIGFGVVIPILPFYAEKYGASATLLGVLLTSYSGMQFLCSPLWGKLSDRWGRKRVMLLTMTGASLSLFILGSADSLWMIFVGRILGGIFAANISVATAYVTDITSEENRTQGMGMIGAAFGIGFILGPALGGGLEHLGYHVPIYVAAGLALINAAYGVLVLREPDRKKEVVGLQTKILSHAYVRKMCLIYFLFTFGITQLESLFAFLMMDRYHYDARHVAFVLVAMALVMVGIQGGLIRRLAKSFGEKRLLLVGVIGLALGFLLIPVIQPLRILMIPLLLTAVGRGLSQPALLSLVSKGGPKNRHGEVMGTFQSSASLARVLGPLAAGALYDWHSPLPFVLSGILMVVIFALSTQLGVQKSTEPVPTLEALIEEEVL